MVAVFLALILNTQQIRQLIQLMHVSDERRESRLHGNVARSSRSSTSENILNHIVMIVEKTSSLFTWTLKQDPSSEQLTWC